MGLVVIESRVIESLSMIVCEDVKRTIPPPYIYL